MTASLIATVSVTVTARVVVYTEARCPKCSRRLVSIPGPRALGVIRESDADRSGLGIAVRCERCKTLVEVIA